MTIGDLRHLLATRAVLLLVGIVLGGSLGWFVSHDAARYYTATATVLPAVGGGSSDPGGFAQSVFIQSRVPEYAAFGKTDSFLDRVISTGRLPLSRDQLSDNLSVTAPKMTALITVGVRATNAAAAVTFADTTADVLASVITERENLLPVRVTVVDSATLPAAPDGKRPFETIGMYALLGLIGGFVVSLLTTRRDVAVAA